VNEAALTELVRLYDRDLLRLCFVISGDAGLAQDAVQSTWQRLWQDPPKLRDESKLKSWLLAVAANEMRQSLRRLGRRRERERAALDSPDSEDTHAERLDLRLAVERLDHSARELLALRYVVGLTGPEIAEVLNISPGAVRSRLHRILETLRKELEVG
jgi:RNA polymerase sigma-70 factor (ECF subfamily)